MEIHIEVTQQDIDEGIIGTYSDGPIARVLKRLGYTYIDVDADRILLNDNDLRYVFKTPRVANLFIDDYDDDHPVEPFSFTLTGPRLATVDDERPPLI